MLQSHVIALIVILLLGVSGLVVWAAFVLRYLMATTVVNEEE
jgi:cytochrome b subunit of formate dehydrogenase